MTTYWLGKHRTIETKQKIRAKLLGRRWKPIRLCAICGKDGVRKGRKYCSSKCFGISRKGIETWIKGKTHSKETRKKLSVSHKGERPWNYGKPNYSGRGEKCPLWKGGVTEKNAVIRTSLEYKNWRRAVFERDDYTCQKCGQ
jgi:5-methylcytosine-specific restriction endonuclease McrA